jgi:hypothetical protein
MCTLLMLQAPEDVTFVIKYSETYLGQHCLKHVPTLNIKIIRSWNFPVWFMYILPF